MGDKAKKIAMLVFALIFIVLMAVIMGTIVNKTNASNTKLVDTLDMTEGMELSNYDGATIKGNAVINAINNGKSLGGKTKLWMYVETLRNTKGTDKASDHAHKIYGYGSASSSDGDKFVSLQENTDYFGSTTYTDLTGTANNVIYSSAAYKSYAAPESVETYYISESAEFKVVLVKNHNDVPVGMHFVQVKG